MVNHTPCITCVWILTAFGYKKHLALNNLQKKRLFEIKHLNFWKRGTASPQWEWGGSPPNATYSARASIRPPTALDPPSCFWTIRALATMSNLVPVSKLVIQVNRAWSSLYDKSNKASDKSDVNWCTRHISTVLVCWLMAKDTMISNTLWARKTWKTLLLPVQYCRWQSWCNILCNCNSTTMIHNTSNSRYYKYINFFNTQTLIDYSTILSAHNTTAFLP